MIRLSSYRGFDIYQAGPMSFEVRKGNFVYARCGGDTGWCAIEWIDEYCSP